MDNLYAIHTLSNLYRGERLREARERHLVKQARADRKQRSGRGRAGPVSATSRADVGSAWAGFGWMLKPDRGARSSGGKDLS